jgi:hypothetical protein
MARNRDTYRIRYAERPGRTKTVTVKAGEVWAEARELARLHGWARIERGGLIVGTFGRPA